MAEIQKKIIPTIQREITPTFQEKRMLKFRGENLAGGCGSGRILALSVFHNGKQRLPTDFYFHSSLRTPYAQFSSTQRGDYRENKGSIRSSAALSVVTADEESMIYIPVHFLLGR